jgi:hypothetical protein
MKIKDRKDLLKVGITLVAAGIILFILGVMS